MDWNLQMKKMLAVGCSFMNRRRNIIPQCEIVADNLNYKLYNKSISGNGNDHILYNTIDSISLEKYDLVLIGWSSPIRWDYVTAPNKWFSYKMYEVIDKIKKPINIELTLFRQWSSKAILLANFLDSRNIKYVMWNSLHCWHPGNSTAHQQLRNIDNFIDIETCHLEDLRNKKLWISETDHHPNQVSQQEWAEKILEKIK